MLNKILVVLVSLLLVVAMPLAAQDRIYKTVDADGNVVYTDQKPSNDSEPLDLPELSVVDSVPIVAPQSQTQNNSNEEAPPDLSFRITSPTQDQTIWNTAYTVDVQMELSTAMPPGSVVVVFVDGEEKARTPALATTLSEVYRGPHTIYAELRLADGQILATTDPVRFIIQQQSALRNQPG